MTTTDDLEFTPDVPTAGVPPEAEPLPTFAPYAFLTGPAGSGKSFLVNRLAQAQSLILCATTGVSAIHLGSTTLHSLLEYYDTPSLQRKFNSRALHKRLAELGEGTETLVIDEVSMLPSDQLDLVVRANREAGEPLRILLTGDMCFAGDTPIMLADGDIRMAQHICLGDQVMGADGVPRRVIATTTGIDHMFRIKQTNGDDYVVNSAHLLALRRSEGGKRQDGNGQRYPGQEGVLLTPSELIKKSKRFRQYFVGYKAGMIALPECSISIEPYFLGLWLGDGEATAPRITTPEPEVIEYCKGYAKRLGLKCGIRQERSDTQTWRISLTKTKRNNSPNWLLDQLRALGISPDKHIPRRYLLNCSKVRLSLLAGLLDSDGSWTGNRYSISQKRERLAREIKQLADGLGFRTNIRPALHPQTNTVSWNVTIGGDTWRIPCIVARKISTPRNLGRSRTTSTLSVEPIGIGRYFGFELEGNPMFLLADGTVVHNCQLPPVKAPYFFEGKEASIFKEGIVRLTTSHRQSDPNFLAGLNEARMGRGKSAVEAFLAAGVEFALREDPSFPGTTIIPLNQRVSAYNEEYLRGIDSPEVTLRNSRKGKGLSEWKEIPPVLTLKIGALVMILVNDTEGWAYGNGSLGTVEEIGEREVWVKLQRGGETVRIKRVTRLNEGVEGEEWEVRCALTGAVAGSGTAWQVGSGVGRDGVPLEPKWAIGSVTWWPLRVAKALTVHKTQSLTLDSVQCLISGRENNFFGSPHMAYVALSRARDPKRLRIVGTPRDLVERIKLDPKVLPWL